MSDEEIQELRMLLEQPANAFLCVYCGHAATEWDHLFPLVARRRPTGHLNVFGNLVPACGTCNHSKGAQLWHAWMIGSARHSPVSRGVPDINRRIDCISNYAARYEGGAQIEQMYDPNALVEYWQTLAEIEALMRKAQTQAELLRASAEKKLNLTNSELQFPPN